MRILIFAIIIFAFAALSAGIYIERQTLISPPKEEGAFPESKAAPEKIPSSQTEKIVTPQPTTATSKTPGPKPQAKLASCADLNGTICSETSEETCTSGWLKTSDSSRCCVSKCVSQPVYTKSAETGKVNVRNCYPNENKNKVAVIIKENGSYDNTSLVLAVSDYLDIVRKNLGVENAGLKKFSGSTMADFNKFVDKLYLNENVAYMILAGDDLPNARFQETSQINQDVVLSGLAFVNRDFKPDACIDIAFSQIIPRLLDSEKEKVDFVVARFRKYAQYQQNPSLYLNQYKRKILRIEHDPQATQIGAALTFYPLGYEKIAEEDVSNSDHEAVKKALGAKPLITRLDVHGSQNIIGVGINYQNLPANDYFAYYATPQEYSNFVKKNGLPSIFVDAGACQSTTIKYQNEKFCCWPQTFLDTDVWAYYSFSAGSGGADAPVTRSLLQEDFIGKAVRKASPPQYFIFGDILARMSL